ncbi:hypothetical protein ACMU_05470 [Actibacterium mucosum KCTC 23349]|uniref:Bleomycin resistance protein n=1 Tax=Actibacterium mucosum KCTC 23349 TaxID=1454373 RepID=A0A037ZLB6_9RHOB|nr:VOC family protein [Actibacterium mucosum]KAJ56394.1 hypothetical protein ACMU_05470 [Actibacterium mucosum KCTC 23349]
MDNSICPIFPSRDFERTKDFYAPLGFQLVAEFPAEGYLILANEQVELHFARNPDHVAEISNFSAFVRVDDANALWASYENLGYPRAGIPRITPAELKPWAVCEMAIVDPDGHLLRCGHNPPDDHSAAST